MTPLLFISIVIIVLTLLVYWVTTTIKEAPKEDKQEKDYNLRNAYRFEIAPELAVAPEQETIVSPNTIKLSGEDAAHLRAFWNLERDRLQEVTDDLGFNNDSPDLVLRLYESSDLLRYHDIQVENLKGRCLLHLHPLKAYYVVLGIMDQKYFIPILTSNTVIKQR
ncbi:MAG: hypothetical protein U9N81_02420 [Bacillota bacterium]|nr:hypothetical protein [Bacillota bacterium]